MNHDDRQLIADLFERMRSVQHLDKDVDAESFIHQSMRENSDSPYLLVQSVLAQEMALQEAGRRIEELEAQVGSSSAHDIRQSSGFSRGPADAPQTGQPAPWEAPANTSKAAPGQTTNSAGLWGAAPSGATATAVPQTGSNARSSGVPQTGKSNTSRLNPEEAPGAARNQARSGGGGFMAQAMTTAAGVAGGMLLANSIGSLFGGGGASSTTPTTASNETAASDASSTADEQTAADQSNTANDQSGLQDASHEEDWGNDPGWGGDDDFGGDFEL